MMCQNALRAIAEDTKTQRDKHRVSLAFLVSTTMNLVSSNVKFVARIPTVRVLLPQNVLSVELVKLLSLAVQDAKRAEQELTGKGASHVSWVMRGAAPILIPRNVKSVD